MATQREIWRALEGARISEDGKAAVRMAEKIFKLKDLEASAEARQWVKLAAALDQAKGNKLLEDLAKKKAARDKRKGLQEGAGKMPLKLVDGAAP